MDEKPQCGSCRFYSDGYCAAILERCGLDGRFIRLKALRT